MATHGVWGIVEDMFQLFLCVTNMDLERGTRYIISWPFNADNVQSTLCWVVATENSSVPLTVSVHFYLEGTCKTSWIKHKWHLTILITFNFAKADMDIKGYRNRCNMNCRKQVDPPTYKWSKMYIILKEKSYNSFQHYDDFWTPSGKNPLKYN